MDRMSMLEHDLIQLREQLNTWKRRQRRWIALSAVALFTLLGSMIFINLGAKALADPGTPNPARQIDTDRIIFRGSKNEVLWQLTARQDFRTAILLFQDDRGNEIASLANDTSYPEHNLPSFRVIGGKTSASLAISTYGKGLPVPNITLLDQTPVIRDPYVGAPHKGNMIQMTFAGAVPLLQMWNQKNELVFNKP